jgi:2'-5' RNA ligase
VARLFTALVPPRQAITEVREELSSVQVDRVKWTPDERWHITLGFFGDDDDPDRRAKWVQRRVAGRPAPRLRLAGGGTFPGVLWVGVEPAERSDVVALHRLAQAAGSGRRGFTAHLTVARWRVRGMDRLALAAPLQGFAGVWFTPAEVLLMRSDPGEVGEGPVYSVVSRTPLG